MFKQATREQSKLRMTIDGPAGSGKSFTSMRFAHALRDALAPGGKIAAIDTERGSLSKYVGESPDGYPWAFDVAELNSFSPDKYTEAIQMAAQMGYSVLVIDSLSHAWEGSGGALEIKDRIAATSKDNSYTAWRNVTPMHNRMVDAILQSPCHVITTMRSRQDYVQDTNEFGKVVGIRRVGMAPIQRPNMEFEFDIVCDMDWSHFLTVAKSRCSSVADQKVEKPGPWFLQPVISWLQSGAPSPVTPPAPTFVPAASAPVMPTAPVAPAAPAVTLDGLMAQYSVEAIMAANGGQIPGTQAELNMLAEVLALGLTQ